MKNLSLSMLFSLFLISLHGNAQEEFLLPRTIDVTSFSIGAGLDYGGFGGNVLVYPQRNIGIFGGFGYALAGFGYNVGTKLRIISTKSTIDPFALVMYGYNAAIYMKNTSTYDKLFYGPTLGIGLDFHSKKRSSYWSLALLVPIRSSSVSTYIDDLKDHHSITFKNELPPIGISVGYRFPSREF